MGDVEEVWRIVVVEVGGERLGDRGSGDELIVEDELVVLKLEHRGGGWGGVENEELGGWDVWGVVGFDGVDCD